MHRLVIGPIEVEAKELDGKEGHELLGPEDCCLSFS